MIEKVAIIFSLRTNPIQMKIPIHIIQEHLPVCIKSWVYSKEIQKTAAITMIWGRNESN